MILVPILLAGLAASGFGRNAYNPPPPSQNPRRSDIQDDLDQEAWPEPTGINPPPPSSNPPSSDWAEDDLAKEAWAENEGVREDYNDGWRLPYTTPSKRQLTSNPKNVPPSARVKVPKMLRYSEMEEVDSGKDKPEFSIRLNGPTRYESLSQVEPIKHNSPIVPDVQAEETSRRQWDHGIVGYPTLRHRKNMLEQPKKAVRSHYYRQRVEKTADERDEPTVQSYLRQHLLNKLSEQIQGHELERQAAMEPENNDLPEVTPEEEDDDVQEDPIATDPDASKPMTKTYLRQKQSHQPQEKLQMEQNHRLRQSQDDSNPNYPQQPDIIPTGDPDQPMENTYRKDIDSNHAQIGKPPQSANERYRNMAMINKFLQELARPPSDEHKGAKPQDDLDQPESGEAKQDKSTGIAEQDEASGGTEQFEPSGNAEQDEPVQADEGHSQLRSKGYLLGQQQDSSDPNGGQIPYYPQQPDSIPNGDPDQLMEATYRNHKQQSQRTLRQPQDPDSYYPQQPDMILNSDPDHPTEPTYRNLKQHSHYLRQLQELDPYEVETSDEKITTDIVVNPDQLMQPTYRNLKQHSHYLRQHESNPYYPDQPDIIPNGDPDQPMENTYRRIPSGSHYLRQHESNPYYPDQPDIIPNGDPDQPMENTYRRIPSGSHYLRQHESNPYYPDQPDIIPNGDPDQPMENTYRRIPSGSGSFRIGHPRRPSGWKKSKPETEDINEASVQPTPISRRQLSSAGKQQDNSRPWEVSDLLSTKHYPTESYDTSDAFGSSDPYTRKRHHRKPHRSAKVKSQKQHLNEESPVDGSDTTPGKLNASRRSGDKKDPQQKPGNESLLRKGHLRRPNRPAKNPSPQKYDVDLDLQLDQSEGTTQEPDANGSSDDVQPSDARRLLGKQKPNEPKNDERSNSLMRQGRPQKPKNTKTQVNDLGVKSPGNEDQTGSQLLQPDDAEAPLLAANSDDESKNSPDSDTEDDPASWRVRRAMKPSGSNTNAVSTDTAPKQRLDDNVSAPWRRDGSKNHRRFYQPNSNTEDEHDSWKVQVRRSKKPSGSDTNAVLTDTAPKQRLDDNVSAPWRRDGSKNHRRFYEPNSNTEDEHGSWKVQVRRSKKPSGSDTNAVLTDTAPKQRLDDNVSAPWRRDGSKNHRRFYQPNSNTEDEHGSWKVQVRRSKKPSGSDTNAGLTDTAPKQRFDDDHPAPWGSQGRESQPQSNANWEAEHGQWIIPERRAMKPSGSHTNAELTDTAPKQRFDDNVSAPWRRGGSKNRLRSNQPDSLEVQMAKKPSSSDTSHHRCSAESTDDAPNQSLDDEDEPASFESQEEARKSSARRGVSSMKDTTAENEELPPASLPLISPASCPCRRTTEGLMPPPWEEMGEDQIPRH